MGYPAKPISDRIEKMSIPEPNTGCWLWIGSVGKKGYATMTVAGHTQMAHIASFTAHNGDIPNGLHIDHTCRQRCCVNPMHLEAVTVAENNRRARAAITEIKRKTHCKNGHPFEGENVRIYNGQQVCRECARSSSLAHYHRRRS